MLGWGGGSSFVWRLAGRLNPSTGQKLAVMIVDTWAYSTHFKIDRGAACCRRLKPYFLLELIVESMLIY